MKRIGIFGGTFNPVHKEHILMAKNVVKELNLDKLIILPSFVSPHKIGIEVESSIHRLNMLKTAFKSEDKIEISDYEILNKGISYTYKTIEHFSTIYKDSEIYFLVGSDMLENFPTWKEPNKILEKATLVLTSRLGYESNDENCIDIIKKLYNKDVIKLDYVGKDLSSTYIRNSIGLKLDCLSFLDENVYEYILKNNLYTNKYYSFAVENLKESRRIHTLGVIMTAVKLAKTLNYDVKKAELTSLLHDIAKYLRVEDYPNFNCPKNTPSKVVHQYLGKYVAKNVLEIDDEEILNAIECHTTGKPQMTTLDKIIFVADLIEPNRNYEGVEELRKAVFEDFESGFVRSINECYIHLKKSNTDICNQTLLAVNYYNSKDIKGE